MEFNSKATVIDQKRYLVPIESVLTHYFAPFLVTSSGAVGKCNRNPRFALISSPCSSCRKKNL